MKRKKVFRAYATVIMSVALAASLMACGSLGKSPAVTETTEMIEAAVETGVLPETTAEEGTVAEAVVAETKASPETAVAETVAAETKAEVAMEIVTETKAEATEEAVALAKAKAKAEAKVETKVSVQATPAKAEASTAKLAPAPAPAPASVHSHTWVDNVVTVEEWAPKMVEVPIYETVLVDEQTCDGCGLKGTTPEMEKHADDTLNKMIADPNLVTDCGAWTGFCFKEEQQVGTKMEDQGSMQKVQKVDGKVCSGCGARQ